MWTTGLAAAAVVVLAAAGCGPTDPAAEGRSEPMSDDTSARVAAKHGSGDVRHELAPLTKRFELLGAAEAATWMSGTLGGSDLPGPTSYWIDAVVTLPRGEAASLADKHRATRSERVPDVAEGLREDVPNGPLVTSEGLDRAFSDGGFSADAFLDVEAGQVVLTAKGQ